MLGVGQSREWAVSVSWAQDFMWDRGRNSRGASGDGHTTIRTCFMLQNYTLKMGEARGGHV